jgi:type VI secretion system secreted protein Hcp
MALDFYVTIEGVKQGKFKGEGHTKGHEDKIVGLAFDYQLTSPRDPATGQASGKRQHSPVKFTKEWGAASPQIFQALVSQEVLKAVLFEFIRANPTGGEAVYQTVKLLDATVSQLHQYKLMPPQQQGVKIDTQELEDVSFTFHKIEIDNKVGKTQAADDWSASK